MASTQRPAGDLDDRIRQQVRVLLKSARDFDVGGPDAHDESLSMSMRLRTLLHSGRDDASLVSGGYLDSMRFCNSVGVPRNDGSLFIGALQQVINIRPSDGERHVSFKPALGYHWKQLSLGQQANVIRTAPKFEDWWTAVMIRDFDQRELTRKFIVGTVANKDGGGHLDAKLPDDYLAVSRAPGTFGISISVDGGPQHHTDDPVPALLRQITWELERSLRWSAPSLLPG